MVRKILATTLYAPFAILLFVALAGAVAALVGGLAGWENLKTSGGVAAGFGAVGFFAWMFIAGQFAGLPEMFAPKTANNPAQPTVSQTNNAQAKSGSLGNNGRSI
jgi:hypothetical protein